MSLRVSDSLSLPDDAVTQTFAILAMKGAGKTNTGRVIAEEMYAAHLPFVVIDPVGSWWGLRSAGDGKGPGLPLPVFGGRHGDVPLERTAGAVLADLVVDERLTCILDLSEFSEGDKTRFLIDFAERLYRRNTDPLHLFLEEADDYIPQRPFREQARLLRAWENIVRRGRARGLGITLITQRSAAINKSVLTQAETLIVLRTTSPQDRKAIAGWIEHHGQSRDALASLPELPSGTAWVWSPQWLRIMKRVTIRRSRTYDSGATPKQAASRRPVATKADIDLAAIEKRMADTIERAKADDPKELRRRIAELERKLATVPAAPAPEARTIEVPVLSPESIAAVEKLVERGESVSAPLGALLEELTAGMARVVSELHAASGRLSRVPTHAAPDRPVRPSPATLSRRPAPRATGGSTGSADLTARDRRVLTAIAQYGAAGRTVRQVALLTGYAVNGGGFRNILGSLRSRGLIEGGNAEALRVTAAGARALGDFDPLPTGPALFEHWMGQLGKAEREVLAVLRDCAGAPLSAHEIAAQTESRYAADGGGFRNALGRLRTLELIEGRSHMTLSEELL
jgi:hypothetical protein